MAPRAPRPSWILYWSGFTRGPLFNRQGSAGSAGAPRFCKCLRRNNLIALQPDLWPIFKLVNTQLGESFTHHTRENYRAAYDYLVSEVSNSLPMAAKILTRLKWGLIAWRMGN
jgi:hypothetical protein